MKRTTIILATALIAVFGLFSPVEEARAGGCWNCDRGPVANLLEMPGAPHLGIDGTQFLNSYPSSVVVVDIP